MSRRYIAQWRKRCREERKLRLRIKRELASSGTLLKATRLYKLGVKNNDRDSLIAAAMLLDAFDRCNGYTDQDEIG